MINKKLSVIALVLCLAQTVFAQTDEKKLFLISNAHLDSQWNWSARTTIDEYVPNTMSQNFSLFEKYPDFYFNFEGAIKYMWMKEYYPEQYAKLKDYIKAGRWNISGGSIDANDVMVPSSESVIRNFLYGQVYYKSEFGRKGGMDMMLPDCFGFPYSLPTLAKHCGVVGFHTQKLSWGSAYDYDKLPPFGIWKGVDGSEIYAIFKGEAYDQHKDFNKDMSRDAGILKAINTNQSQYGLSAAFRYVGPMGDRGGGLKDNATEEGENTPFWLQTSVNSDGPVTVKLSTPDDIFNYMDENRNDNYPVWDNELPMKKHGTGCYTSQTIMKYWNRKNELLADATEKSSVFADWLGGLEYPAEILRESWIRLLWHQFHDDLTGTSIPDAYNISYNDEVLVNSNLSTTLTNSVGALIRQMDTQVAGVPIVVYNPLSLRRTDIVEASVTVANEPSGIRILDTEGNEMLAQITAYNPSTKKLSFIFKATVPSLGYTTYDLRLNETSTIESSLSVTEEQLENDLFKITLNQSGDVSQIYDKKQGQNLLLSPIRMALFSDKSEAFPAWEIRYEDVNTSPMGYVDENVKISIAEEGPLRVSLKVFRTKNGSEYVQYIRLTHSDISERIDFVNEVNWQSRGTLLKAVFPLRAMNTKATYDLSIGTIERGTNASNLYEVAGHQWVDLTDRSDSYGISILNDCKYGWDRPDVRTLRLTLIHTPAVDTNYTYQKNQDLGLNTFTYSFYRHMGKWNEDTQWEASRLNQPMLAFQATKHAGMLGKSCEFASLNTAKVAIKALKKAEESDEVIVRVYELTGNGQQDVKLSFPVDIVSAREVNGIEENVGEVAHTANSLSFDIGAYQPKTFAVKLASPKSTAIIEAPFSVAVKLGYNVDVMSYDLRKNNTTNGVKFAYPAELISNTILSDGIEFTMGDRRDGQKNAVYCDGQSLTLPETTGLKKIYILAASRNEAGSDAEFMIDEVSHFFRVPYYAGNVGVWETEYNQGSEYRREKVAFTATHRHNVEKKGNDFYNFMYIYQYAIPVDGKASKLVLPTNKDVYVFAVSLSDNENDDVTPVSTISSLPEYNDLGLGVNGCGGKIEPQSSVASHQNGANESAEMATDGNLNTKWCVTNYNTPYLELTFNKPVQICHWFVMNAGIESADFITSAFRLQRYESGAWIDVDVVENNTINKVNRYVEPFTTDRVRLQIDKGEQKGTTTRIIEFAVFGTTPTSISDLEIAENNFWIKGNYPNPVGAKTQIQCIVPENVSGVDLYVYDLIGNLIDKRTYSILPKVGMQEIEWDSQSVNNGIYLYTLSTVNNGKRLFSNTKKMIVNKSVSN